MNFWNEGLCSCDHIELHFFSDASELVYGCFINLVCKMGNSTQSWFICAKSEVAPLKSKTIPRLELCGILLSTQLFARVVKTLNVNISRNYSDRFYISNFLDTNVRLLLRMVFRNKNSQTPPVALVLLEKNQIT